MAAPSRDTLNAALKALRSSGNPESVLPDLEAQAEQLRADANGLQEIVNGMRSLLGQSAVPRAGSEASPSADAPPGVPVNRGVPEGMEAVRQIMRAGGVWTSKEILAELRVRGWESKESKTPLRPTEAAMNRLWKVKREIERVGRGQYHYIGSPETRGEENPSILVGVSGP